MLQTAIPHVEPPTMPPAHSSSTLVCQEALTSRRVSFKVTDSQLGRPLPKQLVSVEGVTHASLTTRIKRKWTKLALTRMPAAPMLCTTLAFVLLSDDNSHAPSTSVSHICGAADCPENNAWFSLWCPATGQLQDPGASCMDMCALASAQGPSTLVAALKRFLLFTCTDRWPRNEPLVPLDVIMAVYEATLARSLPLLSGERMQRAIGARLAATQAADFTLLATHLRGVVNSRPEALLAVIQAWAPVMTRVDLALANVDENEIDVKRVRNAVNEVMRALFCS